MKLWIIYRKKYETHATYSPNMMLSSAKRYAIDAEVLFAEYFNLIVQNGFETLYYKGQRIDSYPDIAFFRCYDFELMNICQKKGIKLVNSYFGMMASKDKYATYQIANKNKISIPVVIHSKEYIYDNIRGILGNQFVMKDRYGSQGKNVYLVNNQDDIDNAQANGVEYICQQFIELSRGKDIRLYIVGDKVISSIERFSTNGDFRSNIYLGGDSREVSVPEAIVSQSIGLAKEMGLSICSVDYLYDGKKYFLCEVNASASLSIFIKAGYNMQDIFMNYISSINYINYWSKLKQLQLKENDYIFINKETPILLSAPHAVSQTRAGKIKPKDLGSGELVLKLGMENNISFIIKAKNNGNTDKNDDANYYDCDYKKCIVENVNKSNFIIDIHSLSTNRNQDVVLGTNNLVNLDNDNKLLQEIQKIFERYGFLTEIDTIFSAGEKTISGFIHKTTGAKALQIEINSNLINPLNSDNRIESITNAFKNIFEVLDL